MDDLKDIYIFSAVYVVWPTVVIILIALEIKKKNKESIRLLSKAIFALVIMWGLSIYQISASNPLNEVWGIVSFTPVIIAICYSALGIACVLSKEKDKSKY